MTARRLSGKLADPAFRHRRALAAGQASRAAYERRRLRLGERYATKGAAYAAGYRQGYSTAMHWWARKVRRDQQRRVGVMTRGARESSTTSSGPRGAAR